eukprot:Gb_15617 [translate_table: standard]
MVSTRRGSAGNKRSPPSPDQPGPKRSKSEIPSEEASVRPDDSGNSKELASSPALDEHPQSDLPIDLSKDAVTTNVLDASKTNEHTSDGEGIGKSSLPIPISESDKSKASSTWNRLQKQAFNCQMATNPWGKLLSQYPQVKFENSLCSCEKCLANFHWDVLECTGSDPIGVLRGGWQFSLLWPYKPKKNERNKIIGIIDNDHARRRGRGYMITATLIYRKKILSNKHPINKATPDTLSRDVSELQMQDATFEIRREQGQLQPSKFVFTCCPEILFSWQPCVVLLGILQNNPHVNLCGPIFTIGRSKNCNLTVKDPSVSGILCKLKHTESDGAVILESIGSGGFVQVNGKTVKKNSSVVIKGGDELVLSSSGNHAYIFQNLTSENVVPTPTLSSIGTAENQTASGKAIPFEARSGDPSAVAGASILASLSSLGQDLSILPPPAPNSEEIQQGIDRPQLPSTCDMSDGSVSDIEVAGQAGKGASDPSGGNDVPISKKGAVILSADMTATNEQLNLDNIVSDAGIETDIGKISGLNDSLRPLLRLLTGSAASDMDLSGNIFKHVFEEKKESGRDVDSSAMSAKCQALKEELRRGIIDGRDTHVSFDDFPYYLSENTKSVLITSTFIHLKRKEFTKFTNELPTVSARILLSGPAGSEIYQEMLAKALANHFDAKLLIFDSTSLPAGLSTKDAEQMKERSERGCVCLKQRTGHGDNLQAKCATSSGADVDMTCSSQATTVLNSQVLPKQEIFGAATTKGHSFKTGDRVKYVSLSQNSGYLSPLQAHSRGPSYGYRGKVLLAFEENGSSKVGVRFDKPIPDGVDLGGLCEEDHGFFCSANDLRLESSGVEDTDKLVINALFEVVTNESKNAPLILFMKDVEKSIIGNPDFHAAFKSKLDLLADSVVVIGSHTQADNRKEKSHPGGLLFTKFGSNQTALLDFAFPV